MQGSTYNIFLIIDEGEVIMGTTPYGKDKSRIPKMAILKEKVGYGETGAAVIA
jgi:hypothetical protein